MPFKVSEPRTISGIFGLGSAFGNFVLGSYESHGPMPTKSLEGMALPVLRVARSGAYPPLAFELKMESD